MTAVHGTLASHVLLIFYTKNIIILLIKSPQKSRATQPTAEEVLIWDANYRIFGIEPVEIILYLSAPANIEQHKSMCFIIKRKTSTDILCYYKH